MLSYLFKLLSYLSLDYCDKLLVVFPGFGIQPKDYRLVLPNNVKIIELDIWTDEELDYILKNVDVPGTASYRNWYNKIKVKTNDKLQEELSKYFGMKKIYFFAHSIGTYIAFDIANSSDFEDEIFVLAYGGAPPKETNKVKNRILMGSNDKIAGKYYEDDSCPDDTISIVGANHFSLVTGDGKRRAMKWRRLIGIPDVHEMEDANVYVSRDIITSYLNFYVNKI